MKLKRFLLATTTLAIFLAACSQQPQTVEVTRVVTETVEVEGETVEVTRVVTETVIETVEVEAEPVEEIPDDEQPAATGSEGESGPLPPPPDDDSKVEPTRVAATEAVPAETSVDEPRAETESTGEDGEGATTVAEVTLNPDNQLPAGEVDDNENWDEYIQYLRNYKGPTVIEVDVAERHQIRVTDSQGNPVLGARVNIAANDNHVVSLLTHSDGRTCFFPAAYSETAVVYTVTIPLNGVTETFDILTDGPQREWTVSHAGADPIVPLVQLDVFFVIDATGSMADEINELKENIRVISAQIDALPAQPSVRFGMVTYRDQGSDYLTEMFNFTPDSELFAAALLDVHAEGGGDYAEDLNTALSQAIHAPSWRIDNTVSLIFLVADAPPHLDYGQQNHYAFEMLQAAEQGIKIYPIASSGLDAQGEYIFRQLAQVTGGRFIFLTDNSSSDETTDATTDFDVVNYTVAALDELIVHIVQEELAHLAR